MMVEWDGLFGVEFVEDLVDLVGFLVLLHIVMFGC